MVVVGDGLAAEKVWERVRGREGVCVLERVERVRVREEKEE